MSKAVFYRGRCEELMASELEPGSVSLVLTDPPYFLDKLDGEWKGRDIPATGDVVKNLPAGMRFDAAQARNLAGYTRLWAAQAERVMKPGAFLLAFSQPRLAHGLACGLEEYFDIRDVYAWRFTKRARAKAAGQEHWVRKSGLSASEKEAALKALGGRKTAQLRPEFESIVVAQRKPHGTLWQNFVKYGTGLVDVSRTGLSTVFTCEKDEKPSWNTHPTVKPVSVLEQLIEVFTQEGQIVLDPFMGSGGTAVAALRNNRQFVGIEVCEDYLEIAGRRVSEEVGS